MMLKLVKHTLAGKAAMGLVFYLALIVPVNANGMADESPVYTHIVEDGVYADTLEAVKEIIQGRGINIAHTLPPSEMLERTGPAFGITEQVLKNGEIIEFCSAKISHKLIQANSENITLCPFTISVYVLTSDPANVRMTFRRPHVLDEGSRQAVDEMTQLVMGIIKEAADW